ncbi:MAG: tyrosine--tRNA ligase [Neisseriaceae bacterium]|nr:tyrosine--tRNA ligase [Neisseriaceae bacterium]
MKNSLLVDLQARGLIAQSTDMATLEDRLNAGCVRLYCGFDPTADSLHLGHLVPVLMLKRFQDAGHQPIALVGGATGMIGDPSFKAAERKLNTTETTLSWSEKIRGQLLPFLNFEGNTPAILANNYDWFSKLNVLDFLRDIGKHFSVNNMIAKESVQQRLNRDGSGISFTEFSYSLLQGYDFVELNSNYDCELQIGGSDQWGNIVAGIDLTRRMNQKSTYGLTLPLITKSDGTKFGKTENGAVWLDASKTSPYAFYQFWLSVSDADVYHFMRYFTFLSVQRIAEIEAEDKASQEKPKAQIILAEEMTRLLHGEAALNAAQRISRSVFSGDLKALGVSDLAQLAQDGLPSTKLNQQQKEEGILLVDALVQSGLAKSKTEARTFITSGAVTVNTDKIDSLESILNKNDAFFQRYTILRRGKKLYHIFCWA